MKVLTEIENSMTYVVAGLAGVMVGLIIRILTLPPLL
jgi:hypothetical protein